MWLNLFFQPHYGLPYYIFHVRELGQEITMLRENMRADWGSHIAYTSITFFLYNDFFVAGGSSIMFSKASSALWTGYVSRKNEHLTNYEVSLALQAIQTGTSSALRE